MTETSPSLDLQGSGNAVCNVAQPPSAVQLGQHPFAAQVPHGQGKLLDLSFLVQGSYQADLPNVESPEDLVRMLNHEKKSFKISA